MGKIKNGNVKRNRLSRPSVISKQYESEHGCISYFNLIDKSLTIILTKHYTYRNTTKITNVDHIQLLFRTCLVHNTHGNCEC